MKLIFKRLKILKMLILSLVIGIFNINMLTLTYANGLVDKVKVGTMGTYNPFSYKDLNGELTGYDLEVLREVARRDPTLEFEFIAAPWDMLFPGLDADKFQLLANQIVSNPDRERRYYLTENTYFTCVSQIIVKKGRQDIQSLFDLKGKKIGLTVGNSHTRVVEDWNIAHGNILKITYYEGDIEMMVFQDIENGRIDATVNDPIMAEEKAKMQGLNIALVGADLAADPTRFILQKNATGLRIKQKIDRALKSMTEDGTLSQMSLKQFGKDYTK